MIGITIAIVMTGTTTIGMIRTITIGTICTIGTNEFFPPPAMTRVGGTNAFSLPSNAKNGRLCLAHVMSKKFSNAYKTRYFLTQTVRCTSHRKVKPGDIALIILLEG